MKLENIVKELRSEGHTINFRRRKDGGIIVLEVDGKRFQGASGNNYVRSFKGKYALSDKALTARRKNVSTYIKDFKSKKPQYYKFRKAYNIKQHPDIMKQLRRVQRLARMGEAGTITKDKLRRKIMEEGEDAARAYLNEREMYYRGYANEGIILEVYNRLKRVFDNEALNDYEALLERFGGGYGIITEAQIKELLNALYDYDTLGEDGRSEAAQEILTILQTIL